MLWMGDEWLQHHSTNFVSSHTLLSARQFQKPFFYCGAFRRFVHLGTSLQQQVSVHSASASISHAPS